MTVTPAVDAGRTIADRHAAKAVRDSVSSYLGGQVESALGMFTSLAAAAGGSTPHGSGFTPGCGFISIRRTARASGSAWAPCRKSRSSAPRAATTKPRRVANVAYTANTMTCGRMSLGLIAWAVIRAPLLRGDPLAAEWTWGLVAVAALAIVKRYQSFLIAVLRAHHEFVLTTYRRHRRGRRLGRR